MSIFNFVRVSVATALVLLAGCSRNQNAPLAALPEPTPIPTPTPTAPTRHNLSIGKRLDGRVQSQPAGIDCGSACSASFDAGQLVTLTATPAPNLSFVEWQGACSGQTCQVSMDQDRTATAVFALIVVAPPVVAAVCDAYAGTPVAELKAYEELMHEHSAYSDGDPVSVPADYFRIAKTNGYDFVGSSEHSDSLDAANFVSLHASCDPTSSKFSPTGVEYCFLNPSADKLVKWASTLSQAQSANNGHFLGIRGFEWTSDVFGHINVYYSTNFTNAKSDAGYAVTMDTFWDWFTRAPATPGLGGSATSNTINGGAGVPFGGGSDGLAHFNHPHDKCTLKSEPSGTAAGYCDWNDYKLIPAAVERMFGMETYNDSNRDDRYQPYYTRALDKGWRLAPVGSEDEHFGDYAVEFRPKTVTLATALNDDGFKAAWLARRTYALSPGQHLRVQQLADGAHPMGSKMNCSAGKQVPLTVKMTQKDGSDFIGEYRLFTNGGVQVASVTGKQAAFALPVPTTVGDSRWYFVRVHGGADNKSLAYLAPVWITAK